MIYDMDRREVPCVKPSGKPFVPSLGGATPTATIGGSGTDFSAKSPVQFPITRAEGSFDSLRGVTSASTGNYSLQLNTDFFQTSTCGGTPNVNCRGWEQFVYEGTGGAYIQYWLISFGPAGTACPRPNSTRCNGTNVFDDGWCPFSISGSTMVYCAVNNATAVPASAEPLTSIAQLRMAGSAAAGGANDVITVTDGAVVNAQQGDNRFPDLATRWQAAEFNVFGDGAGSSINFNSGSTIVVRTEIDNGTSSPPSCTVRSFTGESSNLSLDRIPTFSSRPASAIVFTQTTTTRDVKTCLNMPPLYQPLFKP
jgi:hypothetical protein